MTLQLTDDDKDAEGDYVTWIDDIGVATLPGAVVVEGERFTLSHTNEDAHVYTSPDGTSLIVMS